MRTDYRLGIKCHVSLLTANPVASLLAGESESVLLLTVNQPGLKQDGRSGAGRRKTRASTAPRWRTAELPLQGSGCWD